MAERRERSARPYRPTPSAALARTMYNQRRGIQPNARTSSGRERSRTLPATAERPAWLSGALYVPYTRANGGSIPRAWVATQMLPPRAATSGGSSSARHTRNGERRRRRKQQAPATTAMAIERVSKARAAAVPAIQALSPWAPLHDVERGNVETESVATIVMASNTPNSGSAKSTPCVATAGIATPAANTTAPATQRGTLAPSSSVLAACQAISPAAAALRMALRTLPAMAADGTDNAPNSGASMIGQSGGERSPAGEPGGVGRTRPGPIPLARARCAVQPASLDQPTKDSIPERNAT